MWRANENDPTKHTKDHLGLFYLLPNDAKEILNIFGYKSAFKGEYTEFYKTIRMTPIMVRQPALTAMDYVRKMQPDMPNVRVLFYGDPGRGKTNTLVHLLHFLHLEQQHIIMNIRNVKKFCRSPWNLTASTSRPGRIDNPLDAAMILQQFKFQNVSLLEKLKETLTCSKDYTWSLREVTKSGEPLINIADHGINRIIHASDCLAVLCNELMLASDEGKIKLACVLDDCSWLYSREAGVLEHADKKRILVDEVTTARAFKKLIKNNYKNGLVLATCHNLFSSKQNQTPQDALGQAGWDHFDPFLPVNVPVFSRKEFESFMNLYQDIGWLTRPESRTREARDELRFVSGMNPGQLHELCKTI